MSEHGLFLTHRTLPGRRDDVRAIWMQYIAPAVDANPDHLAYYYCFDHDDDDVIRVFQMYRTADAAVAFLQHESYIAYLAAVEPLLEGPPDIHSATPRWVKRSTTD